MSKPKILRAIIFLKSVNPVYPANTGQKCPAYLDRRGFLTPLQAATNNRAMIIFSLKVSLTIAQLIIIAGIKNIFTIAFSHGLSDTISAIGGLLLLYKQTIPLPGILESRYISRNSLSSPT